VRPPRCERSSARPERAGGCNPPAVALRSTGRGSPGKENDYCRFHAHLDANNQPVAPGPDGGIQDPNGNFGTAMMGVITVRGDD
jgi:hypothetical protein